MKKYIINIALFLGIVWTFGSCSDYLDQVPEEKLSEANLFKSKDDVVKVLTQIYSYYYPTIDFRDNCGQAADDCDYNWSNYWPI